MAYPARLACRKPWVQLRDVTTGSLSAVGACAEPTERERRSGAAGRTEGKPLFCFRQPTEPSRGGAAPPLGGSLGVGGRRQRVDTEADSAVIR